MSDNERSIKIIGAMIQFLLVFVPETSAKRIVVMILLTADVPIPRVEGKVVHIVLDNARYQKCRDVCTFAAELGLDLVYLPPYSPNLNLIERNVINFR